MGKWPKTVVPLTPEQEAIGDDFLKYWHEILVRNYGMVDRFNHTYAVKNSPPSFLTTLEIGAGNGEHLYYENLTDIQRKHYVALELRRNMAEQIRSRHPDICVWLRDCQEAIDVPDGHFDRVLAIHVLEHLPNLPAAIKEIHRVCNKAKGTFLVVIPCDGGMAYAIARKISAQRVFERRYKLSYKWFIGREHINKPHEILEELSPYFHITHRFFYPLRIPIVTLNLCIGLTLRPREALAR